MDLVLGVDGTVAQEHVGDIADVAIFQFRRLGAADDVDVVGDGKVAHEVDEPLRVGRDLVDACKRRQSFFFQ